MRLSAKDLLALPRRKNDVVAVYEDLYIVPTGELHESGYSLMALVGSHNRNPVEVAATCDDVMWLDEGATPLSMLRMDMEPENGCVHVWANQGRFEVEPCSGGSVCIRRLGPESMSSSSS